MYAWLLSKIFDTAASSQTVSNACSWYTVTSEMHALKAYFGINTTPI